MLKLAKEMDGLASDIVVCGMVPQRRLPAASVGELSFKELGRSYTEKKQQHTIGRCSTKLSRRRSCHWVCCHGRQGFPALGYVPKTNPLNDRWVTVTGGDAESNMVRARDAATSQDEERSRARDVASGGGCNVGERSVAAARSTLEERQESLRATRFNLWPQTS